MRKYVLQLFVLFCLLAVQGFAATPSIIGLTPNNGTGASKTFVIQVADSAGMADIGYVLTSFGTWAGTYSCSFLATPNTNAVYLLTDDGTSWGSAGFMGQGSSTVLQNSQCTLPMAQMYKTVSGNTVYITFTLTFKPTFGGQRGIQADIVSNEGEVTGPVGIGSWNVTTNGPPLSVASFGPSGTGSSGTFTVIAQDPNGGSDIGYILTSFGQWANSGSCSILWIGNGYAYLLSDAGTAWGSGGAVGSSAVLSNSQCSVPLSSATKGISGFNLSVTFAVNFAGNFSGVRSMAASVNTINNVVAGPVTFGNWTIPNMPADQVLVTTRDFLPMPDPSDPPAMAVSLSQSGYNPATGDIPTYIAGNSIGYSIRGAKPFSQVWVRRMAIQAAQPNPYAQTVCTHSTGQENEGLNDAINGACLLGTTDGGGNLIWNGNIYAGLGDLNYLEFTSAQFYVGPQAPDPQNPNMTRGPMNEDNYIGALTYFVQDANGQPAKPFYE